MLALREAEEKENSLAGFEVDYKKHVLISEDVDIKVKILSAVSVTSSLWTIHRFRYTRGKYSGFWDRTARGNRRRLKCFAAFFPLHQGSYRWQV